MDDPSDEQQTNKQRQVRCTFFRTKSHSFTPKAECNRVRAKNLRKQGYNIYQVFYVSVYRDTGDKETTRNAQAD